MAGRIVLSAILIALVVGAFAWFDYYPASPMVTTLGLPGPKANLERRCGPNYRKIGVVRWVPTRDDVCRGVEKYGFLQERQDVTLDTFTRRIGHAQRFWSQPDSNTWEFTRDSVVTAMPRLGGHAFSCSTRGLNPNVQDTKFWRFPSYFVRLTSYRMVDPQNRSPWVLQMDGYRELPTWCVLDPQAM